MSEQKKYWTPEQIMNFCIDFGLPVFLLAIFTILLVTGIDSEVKTLMAGLTGWIINSGVRKRGKR